MPSYTTLPSLSFTSIEYLPRSLVSILSSLRLWLDTISDLLMYSPWYQNQEPFVQATSVFSFFQTTWKKCSGIISVRFRNMDPPINSVISWSISTSEGRKTSAHNYRILYAVQQPQVGILLTSLVKWKCALYNWCISLKSIHINLFWDCSDNLTCNQVVSFPFY